jgi:hypothetical protein
MWAHVQVTAADLQRHMGLHFTSDRMVLSGVGVDHEELVEYATEFFSDLRTTPSESFVRVPVEAVRAPPLSVDKPDSSLPVNDVACVCNFVCVSTVPARSVSVRRRLLHRGSKS